MLVYNYLVQNGFSIPISVRPYGARSVYHQEWLPSNVVEQLYEAIFHSVDILDGTGNTPILPGGISGSQYYWDIFTWLLHKGPLPFTKNGVRQQPFPTSLIAPFLPKGERNSAVALPRLLELCGCPLKTDDCNYYCSSQGCTMIHTNFKGCQTKNSRRWMGKGTRRFVALSCCAERYTRPFDRGSLH